MISLVDFSISLVTGEPQEFTSVIFFWNLSIIINPTCVGNSELIRYYKRKSMVRRKSVV